MRDTDLGWMTMIVAAAGGPVKTLTDLHGKVLALGSRDEAPEADDVLSDELVVIRRGYRHHGIYAGRGRVIHYAGRIRYPRGRIEEISLEDFTENRPVQVGSVPDGFSAADILRRARSRLGECSYDVLRNNCEHFCNWCQLGEPRSQQIESLTRPARMLVRAAVAVASLLQPWAFQLRCYHLLSFLMRTPI